MKIGDLVRIKTKSLHFYEGRYGIITSSFPIVELESPRSLMWHTVLLGTVEYCFKNTDLEVVNENRGFS